MPIRDVLVNHVDITRKTPGRRPRITGCQHMPDYLLIHTTFAAKIYSPHSTKHRPARAVGCHQRIIGYLAGIDVVGEYVQIVPKGFLCLMREVEYHIDVKSFKRVLHTIQAPAYVIAAAILLVALHFPQKIIVETLYADGESVDAHIV